MKKCKLCGIKIIPAWTRCVPCDKKFVNDMNKRIRDKKKEYYQDIIKENRK